MTRTMRWMRSDMSGSYLARGVAQAGGCASAVGELELLGRLGRCVGREYLRVDKRQRAFGHLVRVVPEGVHAVEDCLRHRDAWHDSQAEHRGEVEVLTA